MTVIAWDGKTLAADKQATNNGLMRTVTKVWKVTREGDDTPTLLATSGDMGVGQALKHWFLNGAKHEDFPKQAEADVATLITIRDGAIVTFVNTPFPLLFEDPVMGWGSGRDFALGALATGATAKQAVQVAIDHDESCGMGIDTVTLD